MFPGVRASGVLPEEEEDEERVRFLQLRFCVQARGEFDTNVCRDGASCGSSVLVSSPSCSWIDSLSMEPTFVSSRRGKGMYYADRHF